MDKENQNIAQKDYSLPHTKKHTLVIDSDDSENEYKPRWYCKN